MGETLLSVRGVTRRFPGVRALDHVDLEVRTGEVHALVGENGAGKSTLMNILGGVLSPDEGRIELAGRPVRFHDAHEAGQAGVAVVFQELSLVPNLSIAENIFANRQPTLAGGFVHRARLEADAQRLLELFQLALPPGRLVKHLSPAHAQLVEILKAISQRPRLLILDEPTSSLSGVETQLLFDNIRRMKLEGVSIIYISHHLPEVFAVADRVTVLRDGRRVATREVSEVDEETLVRLMVGRELSNVYGRREGEIGEELLRVEGATREPAFRDVTFSLRRGEIVGLAGLVGAGRTELGRAIFALERWQKGELYLEGRRLSLRDAHQAIAHHVGYLTEDRKAQGLFPRMSVRDNVIAPSLSRFARRLGWMSDRAATRFAEECRGMLSIATPSVLRRVAHLSGGNQQKVLFSAWTGIAPRVLIVDEPTRGVDVGARSDLYAYLRRLAGSGVGILLISSDLLEILGLSDRILVMREGRLVAEFGREEAGEEAIIAAATGVTAAAS
ncbi:sugar ABC transporter ATP-binding protein [bacterium]|nr:sugar ABC transporter ATP-binding protein [bacterium]